MLDQLGLDAWIKFFTATGIVGGLLIFIIWWMFKIFIPGVMTRFDAGLAVFQTEMKVQRDECSREMKAIRDLHMEERKAELMSRHENAKLVSSSLAEIHLELMRRKEK